MGTIKSLTLFVLVGFAVIGLANNPARAAVMAGNSSFGIGTVTTDNVNNLDWLDWTITAGQTRDSVFGRTTTLGDSLYGWRYATRTEFEALANSAGIASTYFGGGGYTEIYSQTVELSNLLGLNVLGIASVGILADITRTTVDGSYYMRSFVQTIAGTKGYVVPFQGEAQGSVTDGYMGSALVRSANLSAVPIPASLPLFLTGLAGLGVLGRRRKKSNALHMRQSA